MNLKSENQMSISEVRKSTFKYSLLTFNFAILYPAPSPLVFLNAGEDWEKVSCQINVMKMQRVTEGEN